MPQRRAPVNLTPVACESCRKQKVKCDGRKPICGRCLAKGRTQSCQFHELRRVKSLRDEVRALRIALSKANERATEGPPDSGYQSQDVTRIEHQADSASSTVSSDHGREGSPVAVYHDLRDTLDLVRRDFPERSQASYSARPQHTAPLHVVVDPGASGRKNRKSVSFAPDTPTLDTTQQTDGIPGSHLQGSRVNNFGNLGLSSAIKCNHTPSTLQATQLSNITTPPHLTSTLWLEADQVPGIYVQWANQTFVDMRSRGRWLVQQGVDTAAVMGDTCPALFPFSLEPSDQDDTKYWTVSRWATRFLDVFPFLSHSDRLACWVVIFVVFQWQINPSAETYRAIPDWYRPLPVQNFVPHMASLDVLIWPAARSHLAQQPQDFVDAVMSTISVSWPRADEELYSTDLLTGRRQINPEFVAWCLDIENWTLSEESLQQFPQLENRVRTR